MAFFFQRVALFHQAALLQNRPRKTFLLRPKLAIATRAKQLGYDAIHDTVHEMAKDEARHGAGFYGLLKRYFDK